MKLRLFFVSVAGVVIFACTHSLELMLYNSRKAGAV